MTSQAASRRRRAALVVVASVLSLLGASVAAQVPSPSVTHTIPPPSLTFGTYLSGVGRSNLSLAAQRANVPIADAQITIARMFPDPVVTVGLSSWDVSRVGAQNSAAAGISVPVEWPTKRPARVALARANREVAAAELEDFARTLRATAATAYVDALFAQRVLQHRRAGAESLQRLVATNEERQRNGAIGEIVVLQSRIEATRYHGEVVAAEGDARAARIGLIEQMGARDLRPEQLPESVGGDLRVPPRTYLADDLIAHALPRRADLRARREAMRAASARVDLAYANRGVDVAFNLGWQYYTPGEQGSSFQAPPFHAVSAMVSVPLPLSNILNGEVRSARANQDQASLQNTAAELRVSTEIRAALARYEAARDRLGTYDPSLLADNDRLLEMARYAFDHGASRIIELLSAQRTWTETYLGYETALAEHARALIALQTAADQWDLAF